MLGDLDLCCWKPDFSFLDEASSVLRSWTSNTGGWVKVPENGDLRRAFHGAPFFILSSDNEYARLMWETLTEAMAQFISRPRYAHFGDSEVVKAYRSDFVGRRGGTAPVVIVSAPDVLFDDSPEGLAQRMAWLNRFSTVPIRLRDSIADLRERARDAVKNIVAGDKRELVEQNDQILSHYANFYYSNRLPRSGSDSLHTSWLTNFGSLMTTEFELAWYDFDTTAQKLPYVVVPYSYFREFEGEFTDNGDPIDWSDHAYNPRPHEDVDGSYMDLEEWQSRAVDIPDIHLQIFINGKQFVIHDTDNLLDVAYAFVLGVRNNVRPPRFADFARDNLDIGQQFFRSLHWLPVQEWSAPNGFKEDTNGTADI